MLKTLTVSGILVLTTLAALPPLAAQDRSAVSSAELESAVLNAPAPNQATVQRFLQDGRVTEIANQMGLRSADLAAGASSLDEATLAEWAAGTRAADRGLAGGSDTVVISTTAIIIGLLILILLLK